MQFNYSHLQFNVPFKSIVMTPPFPIPPKEGVISYLRLVNAWWSEWSTASSLLTQAVHLLPFQEGWLTTMFCYCYDSCFVLLSTSFFSSSHTVNINDKYKQNIFGNCNIQMPCLEMYFQCLPLGFVPSLALLLAMLMEHRAGLKDLSSPASPQFISEYQDILIYLNSHMQNNNLW